jgi:hypothetical protein
MRKSVDVPGGYLFLLSIGREAEGRPPPLFVPMIVVKQQLFDHIR